MALKKIIFAAFICAIVSLVACTDPGQRTLGFDKNGVAYSAGSSANQESSVANSSGIGSSSTVATSSSNAITSSVAETSSSGTSSMSSSVVGSSSTSSSSIAVSSSSSKPSSSSSTIVSSSSSVLSSSSLKASSSSVAASSSSSSVLSSSSVVVVSSSSACTNSSGSNSITDCRDGDTYATTTIGGQTWLAQNLAYLPSVNDSTDSSTSVAKYYVYGYGGTDTASAKANSNYTTYGVLYNYKAALTACPSGWRLASTSDWDTLEIYVGDSAAMSLRSKVGWPASTSTWSTVSGFAALPSGYYFNTSTMSTFFNDMGTNGYWWTSTTSGYSVAYTETMVYTLKTVNSYQEQMSKGFSVRCIKNP